MAGADNLTPVRSEDEARKKGRNGGIASGKARRERKAMKDTLTALLSMPLKDGKATNIEAMKNLAAIKGKNITVQEAIMLAQIQKAMKGDTRAAEFVRDSSGNKPMDEEQLARIDKLKAETEALKKSENDKVDTENNLMEILKVGSTDDMDETE